MPDFIYILTNEAMPGLIKIGKTSNTVAQRMRELDGSGIPLPFQCYYAARVDNALFVETRLHKAFGDFRVRTNREFFRLDPFRAQSAVELAALEDVTPRGDVVETLADEEAIVRASRRRSVFRFSQVGIEAGAVLVFSRDQNVSAKVVNDREIEFEGQVTSLSASAQTIVQRLGYNWSAVAGPDYWIYDDETLSERRRRFEDEGE